MQQWLESVAFVHFELAYNDCPRCPFPVPLPFIGIAPFAWHCGPWIESGPESRRALRPTDRRIGSGARATVRLRRAAWRTRARAGRAGHAGVPVPVSDARTFRLTAFREPARGDLCQVSLISKSDKKKRSGGLVEA